MAYRRVQLKNIIRQRCDLENTTFETETELDQHINDAAAVLHDLLISCAGENYAIATTTVTTAAGTEDYTIAASNFYRPIRVSLEFDDYNYPLRRYERSGVVKRTAQTGWGADFLPMYSLYIGNDSTWHISFDPPPDAVRTVNLTYHTTPPQYFDDTDLILIPYSDYIVVEACIRIKDKEDRDTLRLERERAAIQKRIEDWGAIFDQANPAKTIDIYSRRLYGGVSFNGGP